MNHTHQANQPQGSKEYQVIVKKRHRSVKFRLSRNQPQITTSERFFVKQPQISGTDQGLFFFFLGRLIQF